MKSKIFALIFALLSFTTFLCAEEVKDRIYVNPSSLVVLEDGFFVEINNEIVGFSSINIDAHGMFV